MINSLFVQILMFGTFLGLSFFYIKPALSEIGTIQDTIKEYEDENTKVAAVNSQLAGYVAKVNEVPADSVMLLTTFIPEKINQVGVIRDIYYIAKESGIDLKNVVYKDIEKNEEDGESKLYNSKNLIKHNFSLTAEGMYNDIKRFLQHLGSNKYPLEMSKITLSVSANNTLIVDVDLSTFTQANPSSEEDSNKL